MSHFVKVEISVKDISALHDACVELGLELVPGGVARGYGSNRIQGEYVIRLHGPYDIAVQRQPDGRFGLVADLWQGHVEREVGPGLGRLKQLYGVHCATLQARQRGLHVRRTNLPDGQVRLALTRV